MENMEMERGRETMELLMQMGRWYLEVGILYQMVKVPSTRIINGVILQKSSSGYTLSPVHCYPLPGSTRLVLHPLPVWSQ